MESTLNRLYADPALKNLLLPVQEFPIPVAFCIDKTRIKAFVLGADPSNKSNGGVTKRISSVFDLDSGNYQYFKGPLLGLQTLGISIDKIYAQNLIRNYCTEETGKNRHWVKIAAYWVDELRNEFNSLDPVGKIPVLLTAEVIYRFLLHPGERRFSANDFYNCKAPIPITPSSNLLNRPLIPFYRYKRGKVNYWLTNPQWQKYTNRIKRLFDGEEYQGDI